VAQLRAIERLQTHRGEGVALVLNLPENRSVHGSTNY
jgi:hypothetical protein